MSSWYNILETPRRKTPPAAPTQNDPTFWVRSRFDFTPDPIQQQILDAPAARLILCCTRQWGKSTITALKALHYAIHHPGALVLVAAPTARQSGEWLLKAASLAARLGFPRKGDGVHHHSLVLPNRSRLVALPGKADNVRCFSGTDLLILDEAAFIPDDLYQALRPMLHKQHGRLWMMSTPRRQFGFFYQEWHRPTGDLPWTRFSVPASECPRIPQSFLDEERLTLGEEAFEREYMCRFSAAPAQVISRRLLEDAVSDLFDPLNGGKPLWID
jgi:hypothetical protein